jgi:hypothetical protein
MSLTIVKRAISDAFPTLAKPEAILEYLRQTVVPVVRDLREKFNLFASGPYDFGTVSSGVGIPTTPPNAARAIYIQLDGGAGTTLWVWEGSSWVGK